MPLESEASRPRANLDFQPVNPPVWMRQRGWFFWDPAIPDDVVGKISAFVNTQNT
jgi:hypothetical protein